MLLTSLVKGNAIFSALEALGSSRGLVMSHPHATLSVATLHTDRPAGGLLPPFLPSTPHLSSLRLTDRPVINPHSVQKGTQMQGCPAGSPGPVLCTRRTGRQPRGPGLTGPNPSSLADLLQAPQDEGGPQWVPGSEWVGPEAVQDVCLSKANSGFSGLTFAPGQRHPRTVSQRTQCWGSSRLGHQRALGI